MFFADKRKRFEILIHGLSIYATILSFDNTERVGIMQLWPGGVAPASYLYPTTREHGRNGVQPNYPQKSAGFQSREMVDVRRPHPSFKAPDSGAQGKTVSLSTLCSTFSFDTSQSLSMVGVHRHLST